MLETPVAMFYLLLIFIAFWSAIPGAVAAWVMRENGRSALIGLILGLAGGPLGVFCVLLFLVAVGRAGRAPSKVRNTQRSHYPLPVIGPLHVSTVWMLAGFSIFLCVWVLSGIAYEIHVARQPRETEHIGSRPKATLRVLPADALQTLVATIQSDEQIEAKSVDEATAKTSVHTQNNFAVTAPRSVLPVQTVGSANQPDAIASAETSEPQQIPQTHKETQAAPTPNEMESTPVTPPQASRTRDATVSAVKRQLLQSGHRVHASLSGDSQTATLSLTGATLTRQTGNHLLGDRRLREALKSVGVRIVVIVSGSDSWTYLL